MKQRKWIILSMAVVWAAGLAGGRAESVKEMLDITGVHGGLIVHVGGGDGRLTAALGAGDGCVVQGLDTNKGNVEKAREHVKLLDLYGKVSVRIFDGSCLPYVDELANLIVADEFRRAGQPALGCVTPRFRAGVQTLSVGVRQAAGELELGVLEPRR